MHDLRMHLLLRHRCLSLFHVLKLLDFLTLALYKTLFIVKGCWNMAATIGWDFGMVVICLAILLADGREDATKVVLRLVSQLLWCQVML